MMLDRKKFYKFYNSVMNLDDRVRFVIIVNKSGVIIYGGQREGIKNYLSEDDQKKSLKHILDSWFLRNQFSEDIGLGKYAMAEYKKVKRFTFPMNDSYFLYITTEPDMNSCSFVENILSMIESF
jgi:hypothetical protein